MSPAIRLGERDLQCSNKNKWANRERRNAHYVMSIKLARAFFLFNTSLPNATATTTTTHVGLFFFPLHFICPFVRLSARSFVRWFVRSLVHWIWYRIHGTSINANCTKPIVWITESTKLAIFNGCSLEKAAIQPCSYFLLCSFHSFLALCKFNEENLKQIVTCKENTHSTITLIYFENVCSFGRMRDIRLEFIEWILIFIFKDGTRIEFSVSIELQSLFFHSIVHSLYRSFSLSISLFSVSLPVFVLLSLILSCCSLVLFCRFLHSRSVSLKTFLE